MGWHQCRWRHPIIDKSTAHGSDSGYFALSVSFHRIEAGDALAFRPHECGLFRPFRLPWLTRHFEYVAHQRHAALQEVNDKLQFRRNGRLLRSDLINDVGTRCVLGVVLNLNQKSRRVGVGVLPVT